MRSHSEWVADVKGCLGSGRTITPTTTGHIFAIRTAIRYVSAATSQHRRDFRHWQILLQKSFWGGERKFLEPLMRFTRGDVRDHIVSSKSLTDLRRRVEKRRSSGEIQRSTFAGFLGLFDFRLLQQYPPNSGHAATAAPCSRADNSSHARRPG